MSSSSVLKTRLSTCSKLNTRWLVLALVQNLWTQWPYTLSESNTLTSVTKPKSHQHSTATSQFHFSTSSTSLRWHTLHRICFAIRFNTRCTSFRPLQSNQWASTGTSSTTITNSTQLNLTTEENIQCLSVLAYQLALSPCVFSRLHGKLKSTTLVRTLRLSLTAGKLF